MKESKTKAVATSSTNGRSQPPTTQRTRREFLKTAVAAGIGAAAATKFKSVNIVTAQVPIVWKVQSTWPTRDIFHESFLDLGKKIEEMAAGRLRLDILPAGAVVGAFDLIDAVNRGVLDGGHGVPAYWYGKNTATSLFGTGPNFGMDAIDVLSWFYYAGGFEEYQNLLQRDLRMNVVSFLYGPMPTQPLGWFKFPVKGADDFKKLKYRTVGLSADLFRELGASVVILPGGEIVPALERGLIDGAEFNNATSDKLLGFPDVRKVYMLQSFHQTGESLEFMVNKGKWDPIPADLKAIVKWAVFAEGADFHYKMIDRNSADLQEMETRRFVRVFTTPKSLLQAQLDAWDRLIAKNSAENPIFKRVVESQKEFARRVVPWKLRVYVDNTIPMARYFAKKKKT